MNIVFMGTPDFAVPCLQSLIDDGHNLLAVYTQTDKPKGRGHKLMPSPVKELAMKHGIQVLQPTSLRSEEEIEIFCSFDADLCVVVAYGKILPTKILTAPRFGCVNVHGSLLPLYRGAAPIQWSVLDGCSVTGVTTMYMAEGLDEGDIILKEEISVGDNDTSGNVYDKLSILGAALIKKTVRMIEKGDAPRIPQTETGITPTYAPKMKKEMSQMDFNQSAQVLHNLVRGLYPWPVARTMVNGKSLKVFNTMVIKGQYNEYKMGQLVCDDRFVIKCGDGNALELLEVQVDGKKRSSGSDFIRGYRLKIGTEIG